MIFLEKRKQKKIEWPDLIDVDGEDFPPLSPQANQTLGAVRRSGGVGGRPIGRHGTAGH